MDILDNVVPYIGNEEEKMEAETAQAAGQARGHVVKPLARA
jgi:aspartate-semialdehyde dehydrogenase